MKNISIKSVLKSYVDVKAGKKCFIQIINTFFYFLPKTFILKKVTKVQLAYLARNHWGGFARIGKRHVAMIARIAKQLEGITIHLKIYEILYP